MQVTGQVEDSLQVSPGALVLAVLLGPVQRFPDQILRKNGLFTVRFVLRPPRPELRRTQTVPVF